MTIYDELLAAGLPVIQADETGAVSMGTMTADQRTQFEEIILRHFNLSAYNELVAYRADRQQIVSAYNDMVARLEQIQTAATPPFTQAGFNQVVQAVKDEALYIERIMKVIKQIAT